MTDFSQEIAARTIWMEARSEGDAGMRAVAHVLRNRLAAGRWGPNLAAVCLAPLQFSCWNTSDPNRAVMARLRDDDPLLARACAALDASATDDDPTGGATHYVTRDLLEQAAPGWTRVAIRTAEIGRHVFFKGV